MGMIKFDDRNRQIHDFEGMCCGRLHPTDIDGAFEYRGKVRILWESKYADAEFPKGQSRTAVEFINDFEKAGKTAIFIVVRHGVTDCNERVYEKDSVIDRLYSQGQWWIPARQETLIERCNFIMNQYGVELN